MSEHNPVSLLCGRDPCEVWDEAVRGQLDTHEQGCPHCQAVAADARLVLTPVSEYLSERVEPPPSMVERIMVRVRTELRPREWLPLSSPHGPVRLERAAATSVLRHLLDQVPGVRARSCQISIVDLVEPADGTAQPIGLEVEVGLSISVAFDLDIPVAVAAVRQVVVSGAETLLNLAVARVDVAVVDVFEL